MWVLLSFASAFFAGITAILAKCGIKKTDSSVGTAVRTIVVLIMSIIMTLIVGSIKDIVKIDLETWGYLILSGLSTGASWLCYFKALQVGDINKVVPIDKSSTILTILLAVVFLHEELTWVKGVCVIAIGVGTLLMIEKKQNDFSLYARQTKKTWLVYAIFSAVFASLTSILGKVGMNGVESNLGTMIRTVVVLIMAWVVVFATGKGGMVKQIPKKELGFILLSGVTTGASWLCYYKALKDGLASVVVPIDKLSILVTIAFSSIVFKEKLSIKALIGLILIVAGTLCMLI